MAFYCGGRSLSLTSNAPHQRATVIPKMEPHWISGVKTSQDMEGVGDSGKRERKGTVQKVWRKKGTEDQGLHPQNIGLSIFPLIPVLLEL